MALYNAAQVEKKWYDHWMKQNYFHSEPDEREAYSIVIPPPNVTGVLHMGHMLNNTIQDVLIRKARLEGKNACWVPGTDHASIATEAKVVKMLRERGIKKSDIGREEFLKYAWEWKEKYGGIILEQLKRLGASCDWERTRFTMEPKLSAAVLKVFVDLYKKGRIYRGLRMTNWDPEAQTALSNEEVIHGEEDAQLFHIRYDIEGEKGGGIVIATQRPETIMADTAIAVNPKDERFKHLIGKKALIPLINRAIPIIEDDYVDIEFGTGALKITPAHDQNDNEVGQRHNLEVIDILNADGTLNEKAQILVGEDRFAARKKIKPLLKESGHLIKLENYRTKIGRSERTGSVVEPRLTLQWYVDMKDFAKTALHSVSSGQVNFYPRSIWNMYYSWLNENNVRDWCISRQLWWGQRIPAWYYDGKTFVAETAEEALEQAKKETGNARLTLADLTQDEDVLDTWFSSWLWPISVFDGFETQEELKYYYPTNALVTGWDIMFFWVARMIMSGYEWSGELMGLNHVLEKGRQPFHDVYFTGMVRDLKRQKMSKSLGNSPNALNLLDKYGADGVRFGMLSSGAAGNDIIFDAPIDLNDPKKTKVLDESQLCAQGSKFCNKIWNALAYIQQLEVVDKAANEDDTKANQLVVQWMHHKYNKALAEIEANYGEYRLSDALMNLYGLIWNDFFSWYLEVIKPGYQQPIDRATYEATLGLFEKLMLILHPFMPFVTEETWHQIKERKQGEDCIVSSYPSPAAFDDELLKKVEKARDLVTKIKDSRNKNAIKQRELLELFIQDSPSARALFAQEGLAIMIKKRAYLSDISFVDSEPESCLPILSGTEKYYIKIEKNIDVEAERERLTKDLEYQKGFVFKVQKKLSNERFVSKAPAAVVERERKKLADGEARIKILEESLARLN